jgi:preprotein translocase subunit YajC
MSTQALVQLMPLVLLIFIMYFLLIRPQKKREKSINQMRSGIKVGDEIITIGGICAKVIKIRDEKITIEVGADKTKFEIMRWAVSKVVNATDEIAKEPTAKTTKGKRTTVKKETPAAVPEETAEEPASEQEEPADKENQD